MAEKTLFTGARLIDGNGGSPLENTAFLVEGCTITKLGTVEAVRPESDTKVVDLTGKTVLPGLINAHVHIINEPVGNPAAVLERESIAKTALRGAVNLKKHLYSGVTYLRDMGGAYLIDIDLKNTVAEGLIEGPNLLVSGKYLTMTGGQGWKKGRECDGRDDVRKAAREQLKAGADIIKLMATGGVMTAGVEPGSPQLTREEMEVAVEEAHKAGKKAAAHAHGATGAKNAILAGVDSIEHGAYIDDEAIEMMLERDVYLVPTLVAPYFIVKNGVKAGIPDYVVEKAKQMMEQHVANFKKAKAAGVKIAMGTDSGTPFNLHGNSPMELKLMVEAGLTPMEVIVASTKSSAELMGIDKQYGTLEEGKVADFIVLAADPLANIDALFSLEMIYKAGKRVK